MYIENLTWNEASELTWEDVSDYKWSQYESDEYYLLKDSYGDYYSIINNLLVPLSITSLTANNFLVYGFTTKPNPNLLMTLSNPVLYIWRHEARKQYIIEINGIPSPKIVTTSPIEYSDSTIIGINSFEAEYSGTIGARFSIDNGNYKYYNNGSWVTSSNEFTDMEDLKTLSGTVWGQLMSGGHTIKVQVILSANSDKLTYIRFKFNNDSPLTLLSNNEEDN